MSTLNTQIAKLDSCPDFSIDNTTEYPTGTSHDKSNFNEYVKVDILLPSDFSVSLKNGQYPNEAFPPSDNKAISYATCLTGLFSVEYCALPTPPDAPVVGQGNTYDEGDCLYFNGKIYKILPSKTLHIPIANITNQFIIDSAISASVISEIQESEVSSKYKATLLATHWCSLLTCLKDKLSKLNCLIVKEPTRNDICEMELYTEILELNYIYAALQYGEFDNLEDNEVIYNIKSSSNYINSKCCACKKC